MIKHEQHLDRFDQLFGHYFKGVELLSDEEFMQIPADWLEKNFENLLSDEDKEYIKSMDNLEELMERLKQIMEEQKKET